MESRIKILGHPAHQLLVPFPIGALSFSVAMDTCYSVTGNRQHLATARRALDFGLLTAIAAAPFGLVDVLAIPKATRARKIGVTHGLGNLVMLGLFATSRLLRHGDAASTLARSLSASAFALAGVTAWLGGELVVRHAIGVSDAARPSPKPLVDASQVPSLSEQPSIVDWGKRA